MFPQGKNTHGCRAKQTNRLAEGKPSTIPGMVKMEMHLCGTFKMPLQIIPSKLLLYGEVSHGQHLLKHFRIYVYFIFEFFFVHIIGIYILTQKHDSIPIHNIQFSLLIYSLMFVVILSES